MTDESAEERRKAVKETLDKCSETVNRAMVSLLAVSLFCLLTTFGASDRSLVAPEATIKVPFADAPISFVGFLIVAPLLLVVLTIYLHVFYGYWRELDTERRAQGLTQTYPTLFSIDRRIGRLLTALIFYWLTPLVVATITWKAAARFEWGLPVAVVTVLLTASLVFLQFVRREPARISRRMRALSLGVIGLLMLVAVAVGLVTYLDFLLDIGLRHADYWERPLNLLRADLQAAWLVQGRFRRADLRYANLQGAKVGLADLRGADLRGANLRGADLRGAQFDRAALKGADLRAAEFSGVNLSGVDLREADLRAANLSGANLSRADLREADLREADLSGVKLGGAKLRGAKLSGADLRGAALSGADLVEGDPSQAVLTRVDLEQTDLSKVVGLTCDQVRAAKTDKDTKLPDALECPTK